MNDINEEIREAFNLPKDKTKNIIKVVGVGGGGGNAVMNMYRLGICNVSFAVCNTDSQALAKCEVPVRIQLGESGLGTGGHPEKGRQEAEEDLAKIEKLFQDETQMVFITAGMGGGTGTGAAPVVARIAKECGVLTVGIVTIPFRFEGKRRIKKALQGVEEMRKSVDALLVINNEKLIDLYGDGMMDTVEALAKADDILTVSTKSIAEIITVKGIINRDFQDVRTVMKDGGMSLISVGEASGEHRIEKAFMNALNSPLLSNLHVDKAERLLYIIYTGEESPVCIHELREVTDLIEEFSQDVEVLWGLYPDNSLGENVKVAVIASGLDEKIPENRDDLMSEEEYNRQIGLYYGIQKQTAKPAVQEVVSKTILEVIDDYNSEFRDGNPNEGFTLFKNLKSKLESIVEKIVEYE